MMFVKVHFPLAAILLSGAMLALAAPSTGVLGEWQTPAGSVIRIDRCGLKVCLLIEKLPPRVPVEDLHNPDPALRGRALCGLKIGTGFTLSDADHASGGTLYDPKTGKTYRGNMTADGNELHLRGYVGIPLFGVSQSWKRTTAPAELCKQQKAPAAAGR